jgi:hypothetical protein
VLYRKLATFYKNQLIIPVMKWKEYNCHGSELFTI